MARIPARAVKEYMCTGLTLLMVKQRLLTIQIAPSNPSYLAVSPNGQYVYAVNETNGKNPGKVSAYASTKNR
jgi:6-phosphogluconolactonase (cycloisomerase 2 family)